MQKLPEAVPQPGVLTEIFMNEDESWVNTAAALIVAYVVKNGQIR
jgi:hypothetical protein